MRASGLAAPRRARGDVAGEQIRDAAALEVRVAVAEREQPIARAQALERRPHVLVEVHAIARGEEHLERLVGERLGMARGARTDP